jgi:hypothetical protein
MAEDLNTGGCLGAPKSIPIPHPPYLREPKFTIHTIHTRPVYDLYRPSIVKSYSNHLIFAQPFKPGSKAIDCIPGSA